MASRFSELLEALDEIIIAINGSTVTEGPSADQISLATKLFYSCRAYIQQNRLTIDLADGFAKRRDICMPHFQFPETMSPQMKQALLDRYSINQDSKRPNLDDKGLVKLWTKFKRIESFNRNSTMEYDEYLKTRAKGGESGTYIDDDIILSIWENTRKLGIESNARKVT